MLSSQPRLDRLGVGLAAGTGSGRHSVIAILRMICRPGTPPGLARLRPITGQNKTPSLSRNGQWVVQVADRTANASPSGFAASTANE